MSNFLELVKTRRSVRTFNGEVPDAAVIDELKAFADALENPYGIKVRFEFLERAEHDLSSPVLTGEKLYVSAMVEKGQYNNITFIYSYFVIYV